MKTAVLVWPHPRKRKASDAVGVSGAHELMDGLSYLNDHGYQIQVVDPFPFPLNLFARSGSLLAGLDLLRALYLLLLYPRFHILISIGCSSAFFFVLFRRILRFTKPVIVIDPALGDDYPSRQRLQAQLLPYVDHVVVFGSTQVDYLRTLHHGQVQCSFIPHRIDSAFFRPIIGQDAASSSESFLLCIGNDPYRDFETLYQAASQGGARILVHTQRPLPATTPSTVQSSRMWLSFEELRSLYQDATVVILPLHPAIHAGGINSLLEAMSMGKAVIVSDSPGIRDYVQHKSTAWVIPCEDPTALRDAIKLLSIDRDVAARLGANARLYCQQNCAMSIYARRIAAILDSATRDPQ